MQVSSGIGGSATTIVFAIWHQRFGSVINRLRLTVFGVSLVMSLFLRLSVDLRGIRNFTYTRLWSDCGASKGGQRTLTHRTSRRSTCFIRIESKCAYPLLRLARWNVENTPVLGVQKKVFRRASLLSSAKPRSTLP